MASASKPLRIMHVFRSPVGGIFRHVRDLTREHAAQGHEVGIICDNNTGGDFEENNLNELAPDLALGLHRFTMHRSIGLRDIAVVREIYATLSSLGADVLHAHGAKGGAYARLAGAGLERTGQHAARLYTPHGGSVHFDPRRLKSKAYFKLERALLRWTDQLIFVSAYERDAYFDKIGQPACRHSLIFNGIGKEEFDPIFPDRNATDFLYVGMMRDLKGVDVFIEAMGRLASITDKPVSATLVGDGPDMPRYRQLADRFGKHVSLTFHPPMPAREAFKLGRCLVVPSRTESMPYLVLEALGAQKPVIATSVGGIPEIFGTSADTLVPPDNPDALAEKMATWLSDPKSLPDSAELASEITQKFSISLMADEVLAIYRANLKPGRG